jgi:hypothetical protein
MNARFSLPNDSSALYSAGEVVEAMLSAWGCVGADTRSEARAVVTDVVNRVSDEPAPQLIVGLRLRAETLGITVGAYEARGIRPVREETASLSGVICGGQPSEASRVAKPAPIHAPPNGAPQPVPPVVTAAAVTPAAVTPPRGPIVTLVELAQRYEESPWFIRRRVASGTLPAPDDVDAAGEPVWYAGTLDAWRDPAE